MFRYRLTKLAGLLVKSLAKPVSKRIKHEFSRYETTQNLLVFIGQTNHQITSRMTIWSAGYKVRSITPLDDEKAMKAGSEFVGESFIFIVTASIVVFEYSRSKDKEQEKTQAVAAQAARERAELQAKLHALNVRLKALERTVEQNSQSIFMYLLLGQKVYQPPPAHELVPIDDDDDVDNVDVDNVNVVNETKDEVSVLAVVPTTTTATDTTTATANKNAATDSKGMIASRSLEKGKSWWDWTYWSRR